jgi:hypothetical protein
MRNNYADQDAAPVFASANHASSPVTITVDADPDQFHVLDWIHFSSRSTNGPHVLEVYFLPQETPVNANGVPTPAVAPAYKLDAAYGGINDIDFAASPLTGEKNQKMIVHYSGDGLQPSYLNIRYR